MMRNNRTLHPNFLLATATAVALIVSGGPDRVAGQSAEASVPAAHEQASCRKCHTGQASPAEVADSRCLSCHHEKTGARLAAAAPGTPAAGLDFHGAGRKGCVACHVFHDPNQVSTAAGPVDLAAAAQADRGHCKSCHFNGADRSRLSTAHLEAAALYHAKGADLTGQSPSEGCLNCHDRASESPWLQATTSAPITFQTHASHPYGKLVVPGSGPVGNRMRTEIDPRIPLFDGRIECQTCHDLTSGTKDLLVAFTTPKQMCLGCHDLKFDRTPADDTAGPGPLALAP